MDYAVIKTGGKQYKVSEGETIEVDKLAASKDGVVNFDQVLLVVRENKIEIGTPTVANVTVKAKVLEQKKGEKIRVAKFKSKVRYRRVMGFRSLLTKVKIEKIGK